MAALHAMRDVVLHVVAQVVESVFVVRAVGDIRAVRRTALRVIQVIYNDSHAHPEAAIERAHPFRVAPGQIIVYRDNVHSSPGQRIQHGRKSRNQRLPFSSFHFRDFAIVKNQSANQLHIKMPHV